MTTEKNTERLHLMVTPTLREDLAQAAGYLRISEAALIRDILRRSDMLREMAAAGRRAAPAGLAESSNSVAQLPRRAREDVSGVITL